VESWFHDTTAFSGIFCNPGVRNGAGMAPRKTPGLVLEQQFDPEQHALSIAKSGDQNE
jgi:hypothetical protein